MNETQLNILQTAILLLDGVSEAELMLRLKMGQYLNKASKIVEIINKE